MFRRTSMVLAMAVSLGAVSGPVLGWDLVWPLFGGVTALSALGAAVVGVSLARAGRP